MNLVITLESTCDLNNELVNKYDLKVIHMNYTIAGKEFSTEKDDTASSGLFSLMKRGEKVFTSQINETCYEQFFESNIKNDQPIVHIGLSSGLSGTIQNAKSAAERINEKHGKQVVYIIDTLCGSCGQGMLAMFAREYANYTDNIQDVIDFVDNIKLKINHCYTLDDLKYQVMGGRIKPAIALIGKLLNIKPLMFLDRTGKLALVSRVFSRKKSITSLAEKCVKCFDPDYKIIFIAHADCEQEAKIIKDQIQKSTNICPIVLNLGPIIAGHSGPGTLSVYFVGENR